MIGGIPRLFIIMIGGIVLLALINAPEVLAFLWVIGIVVFYVYLAFIKLAEEKETREMGERFA